MDSELTESASSVCPLESVLTWAFNVKVETAFLQLLGPFKLWLLFFFSPVPQHDLCWCGFADLECIEVSSSLCGLDPPVMVIRLSLAWAFKVEGECKLCRSPVRLTRRAFLKFMPFVEVLVLSL